MKKSLTMLFMALACICLELPAQAQRKVAKRHYRKTAKVEYGVASYYANKFNGRLTASGEIYSSKKFTAAHNSLPFGTRIRVTNMRNKRSVIVKVNDRLHYKNKRLVDLSAVAAKKLGYTGRGLAKVKVEVLDAASSLESSQASNK
jgi:rare lipoprotein A